MTPPSVPDGAGEGGMRRGVSVASGFRIVAGLSRGDTPIAKIGSAFSSACCRCGRRRSSRTHLRSSSRAGRERRRSSGFRAGSTPRLRRPRRSIVPARTSIRSDKRCRSCRSCCCQSWCQRNGCRSTGRGRSSRPPPCTRCIGSRWRDLAARRRGTWPGGSRSGRRTSRVDRPRTPGARHR